jgi:hypothetical protein
MNKFQEHGFAGAHPNGFERAFKEKYSKQIDICMEINRLAQEFQYKLEIHNRHSQELVAGVLFSRILSTYQAALLLCFKGMKPQVEMLIRCILESFFPLVAISKDASFVKEFVNSDEIEKSKAIRRIIDYKKRHGITDLSSEEKVLSDTEERIKTLNCRKISTYDCAKKAGLLDYYDTVYPYMSSAVHASVRSLEDSLVVQKGSDVITALKNEPEIDHLEELFSTLVVCLLISIESMCIIFEIDQPENLAAINQAIEKLSKKHI